MNERMTAEIIAIIRSKSPEDLKESLKYHPHDIAAALPGLEPEERKKIYSAFSDEELAEIFSYLDEEDAEEILSEADVRKIAAVISEMEPDDAVDLLATLDETQAKNISEHLDEEVRENLAALYRYEEGTAGSIMTTNFISIASGKDIRDLMKLIVQMAPEAETINTSFVTDEAGKLLGTVDLKKLIIARAPKTVDEIMKKNFMAVDVNEEIEVVVKKITDYDIYDMPVLENGILKGIITMDDALAAISEESEEDYAKLAGLTETEKIEEDIRQSIRKRLPILALLLVLDIFVAFIASAYDYLFTIPALAVITVFQPIILALAGNTGIQSLGVTIRKITTAELENRSQIWKHLAHELALGILSSIIIGALVFLFTTGYLYLIGESALFLKIGTVVGLSVILGLVISNLFGTLTPIILDKLNFDPAVISGPFITTVLDIIAVLIYFSLTSAFIYAQIT